MYSDFAKIVFEFLEIQPKDKPLLRLSVIKSYLMTSKLGADYDDTHDYLLETIQNILKETESNEIKVLCIENLALLMVTQRKVLNENLSWFQKQIENERPEPRKSHIVGLMLRALFDCSIVHSLFLKKTTGGDD
jgi:Nuclear condensing complex subunits, C-term domain